MEWDEIIKAYPDNADKIEKARGVHERISAGIRNLDIPRLDRLQSEKDRVNIIPVAELAKICADTWTEIFEARPGFDVEEALSRYISQDEVLDDVTGADEDFPMFVRSVLTVFFHALREKNSGLIPADWISGNCPFCKSYPRIAFDYESRRQLFCPLCGQDWTFKRLTCPYCNNHDHNTLGYFDAEGIDGIRVYYCNECKHYIKAIDTRARIANDAETEDVLSMYMDDAAIREGFKEAP